MSYDKSAISFGPRTSEEEKTSISREIGMKLVKCHERYLGLPANSIEA